MRKGKTERGIYSEELSGQIYRALLLPGFPFAMLMACIIVLGLPGQIPYW